MGIGNSTDRFNGVVASLAIKVRCVVAVEEQVDDLTGISNPYSGVNIADGDRILLTAQTDPIENGVWDVRDDGVWTRAFDWDGNRDVEKGSTVWAGQSGGRDKLWQVQTAGVILPGSTAQTITILFDPETAAGGQPNPIILPEIAGAGPDVPGEGQIWVRDDGPNVLMFTNDDGDDFVINVGGGDPDRLIDPATNVAMIALGGGLVALRSVGNTGTELRNLEWQHSDGTTQFSIGQEFSTAMIFRHYLTGEPIIFRVGIGGGNRTRLRIDGDQTTGGVQIYAGTGGLAKLETTPEGVEIKAGTLFLAEQAAQEADQAGFGQIYVDSSDDSLHYVTEAGVDFNLLTGGGGGGVIVEDEGVPLATTADTLDFVGAGVVASGAGTTKTITIAGGATNPAGANEEIQYNDNGAFGASPRLRWDVSEGSLDIDAQDAGVNDGAVHISRIQEGATGLRMDSINGNTTFHNIWVSFDSGGESSWKLVDDHTGALRTIFWEDDFGAVFLEFEVDGADDELRMGGHAGSEKVFMSFGAEVFSIRNGTTLYFEEVASANPELTAEGQVWVRSDTPNTLMFTDDAGTDFVVGGALAAATTFVMVTPVSISLGADDVWATISNAALATAGATHALIKTFCQVAPTASAFATQVIHLRETGSAIVKANSNRACMAGEEDSSALGIGTDTNDAWVELDGNQDFDILQDPTGTATTIAEAWIVGYMA